MKKLLIATLGTGFVFGVSMFARAESRVATFNSIKLMQESKEGKDLLSQNKKDVEKFQSEVKKAQEDLNKMQEDLSKKAKVLSQEALEEQSETLNLKKKSIERELGAKEETLQSKVQKKIINLRDKYVNIAKEFGAKGGYDLFLDENAPGVVYVASALDKTDAVLSIVNERYEKNTAAKSVEQKLEHAPAVKTANKEAAKEAMPAKTLKTA